MPEDKKKNKTKAKSGLGKGKTNTNGKGRTNTKKKTLSKKVSVSEQIAIEAPVETSSSAAERSNKKRRNRSGSTKGNGAGFAFAATKKKSTQSKKGSSEKIDKIAKASKNIAAKKRREAMAEGGEEVIETKPKGFLGMFRKRKGEDITTDHPGTLPNDNSLAIREGPAGNTESGISKIDAFAKKQAHKAIKQKAKTESKGFLQKFAFAAKAESSDIELHKIDPDHENSFAAYFGEEPAEKTSTLRSQVIRDDAATKHESKKREEPIEEKAVAEVKQKKVEKTKIKTEADADPVVVESQDPLPKSSDKPGNTQEQQEFAAKPKKQKRAFAVAIADWFKAKDADSKSTESIQPDDKLLNANVIFATRNTTVAQEQESINNTVTTEEQEKAREHEEEVQEANSGETATKKNQSVFAEVSAAEEVKLLPESEEPHKLLAEHAIGVTEEKAKEDDAGAPFDQNQPKKTNSIGKTFARLFSGITGKRVEVKSATGEITEQNQESATHVIFAVRSAKPELAKDEVVGDTTSSLSLLEQDTGEAQASAKSEEVEQAVRIEKQTEEKDATHQQEQNHFKELASPTETKLLAVTEQKLLPEHVDSLAGESVLETEQPKKRKAFAEIITQFLPTFGPTATHPNEGEQLHVSEEKRTVSSKVILAVRNPQVDIDTDALRFDASNHAEIGELAHSPVDDVLTATEDDSEVSVYEGHNQQMVQEMVSETIEQETALEEHDSAPIIQEAVEQEQADLLEQMVVATDINDVEFQQSLQVPQGIEEALEEDEKPLTTDDYVRQFTGLIGDKPEVETEVAVTEQQPKKRGFLQMFSGRNRTQPEETGGELSEHETNSFDENATANDTVESENGVIPETKKDGVMQRLKNRFSKSADVIEQGKDKDSVLEAGGHPEMIFATHVASVEAEANASKIDEEIERLEAGMTDDQEGTETSLVKKWLPSLALVKRKSASANLPVPLDETPQAFEDEINAAAVPISLQEATEAIEEIAQNVEPENPLADLPAINPEEEQMLDQVEEVAIDADAPEPTQDEQNPLAELLETNQPQEIEQEADLFNAPTETNEEPPSAKTGDVQSSSEDSIPNDVEMTEGIDIVSQDNPNNPLLEDDDPLAALLAEQNETMAFDSELEPESVETAETAAAEVEPEAEQASDALAENNLETSSSEVDEAPLETEENPLADLLRLEQLPQAEADSIENTSADSIDGEDQEGANLDAIAPELDSVQENVAQQQAAAENEFGLSFGAAKNLTEEVVSVDENLIQPEQLLEQAGVEPDSAMPPVGEELTVEDQNEPSETGVVDSSLASQPQVTADELPIEEMAPADGSQQEKDKNEYGLTITPSDSQQSDTIIDDSAIEPVEADLPLESKQAIAEEQPAEDIAPKKGGLFGFFRKKKKDSNHQVASEDAVNDKSLAPQTDSLTMQDSAFAEVFGLVSTDEPLDEELAAMGEDDPEMLVLEDFEDSQDSAGEAASGVDHSQSSKQESGDASAEFSQNPQGEHASSQTEHANDLQDITHPLEQAMSAQQMTEDATGIPLDQNMVPDVSMRHPLDTSDEQLDDAVDGGELHQSKEELDPLAQLIPQSVQVDEPAIDQPESTTESLGDVGLDMQPDDVIEGASADSSQGEQKTNNIEIAGEAPQDNNVLPPENAVVRKRNPFSSLLSRFKRKGDDSAENTESALLNPADNPFAISGMIAGVQQNMDQTDNVLGTDFSAKLSPAGDRKKHEQRERNRQRLAVAGKFMAVFSLLVPIASWVVFYTILEPESKLSDVLKAKNYGVELADSDAELADREKALQQKNRELALLLQRAEGIKENKVLSQLSENRVDYLDIMLHINRITLDSLNLTASLNRAINMLVFNTYSARREGGNQIGVSISGSVRDPKSMSWTKLTQLMESINQDETFDGASLRSFSKADDQQGGTKSSFSFNFSYEELDPELHSAAP
jgi:hypothetical protein